MWNWVYNNRYRLCNPIYPDYPPHISDLYKEAKLPYEYCEMLSVLFPHFGNKKIYAPDSEYRISSPLYINNYFLLSLPKEYITDAEIQNFLRHAGPEEMIDLLNSKDAESLNELIRRVAVMYNMTNIPNKRKRYLSDFMIYSDTYFANQLQMPTFSYYTFNLSSTFVESYLNTMERPEWKKYILDTLPKSNIYTLTRASRVLYGCINYCFDISHISPDTMSEDFKEIFSEIARRIVNSYKKYPDAFEHDEFIFMILTLIASDKHLAKEVFHYYVQTQEKVEKYIEKVSKAGCTMAGFEEVLPLEYLQSGEYHKTICKYTNGCDTSGYPVLG